MISSDKKIPSQQNPIITKVDNLLVRWEQLKSELTTIPSATHNLLEAILHATRSEKEQSKGFISLPMAMEIDVISRNAATNALSART